MIRLILLRVLRLWVVVVWQSQINLSIIPYEVKRISVSALLPSAMFFSRWFFCCLFSKTWSVRLIKGYVLNDQVKATQCANCKSTAYALAVNFSNPNLFLFACRDAKCRHRMLRFDFDDCSTCKANATGNWNPWVLSPWNNSSCKSYTGFWAYPSHFSASLLAFFYADTCIRFGLISDPYISRDPLLSFRLNPCLFTRASTFSRHFPSRATFSLSSKSVLDSVFGDSDMLLTKASGIHLQISLKSRIASRLRMKLTRKLPYNKGLA